MKAKLTIEDKEFEVDISDEQAKALTKNKKTGFERVKCPEYYFRIGFLNKGSIEAGAIPDNNYYSWSNYFSDHKLAEDYIRFFRLFLKLSQWQALNDEPISGVVGVEIKGCENGILAVGKISGQSYFGSVKFSSHEKANEAIEQFREELEWYFTEFKPRLDM